MKTGIRLQDLAGSLNMSVNKGQLEDINYICIIANRLFRIGK
jgi:hypothetical protein